MLDHHYRNDLGSFVFLPRDITCWNFPRGLFKDRYEIVLWWNRVLATSRAREDFWPELEMELLKMRRWKTRVKA